MASFKSDENTWRPRVFHYTHIRANQGRQCNVFPPNPQFIPFKINIANKQNIHCFFCCWYWCCCCCWILKCDFHMSLSCVSVCALISFFLIIGVWCWQSPNFGIIPQNFLPYFFSGMCIMSLCVFCVLLVHSFFFAGWLEYIDISCDVNVINIYGTHHMNSYIWVIISMKIFSTQILCIPAR